jgi:putative ABC transport system permease protein
LTGLGAVVRAGVGRRRVHTAVLALTTLVAVAASVLGAGLLVASNAPFDKGFAAQQGAHLTALFDASRVTAAHLEQTAATTGVTAAAGPFPTLSIRPTVTGAATMPTGYQLPPITVVGRADPGGTVDRVTLASGHWPTRAGEIVLARSADLPPDVGQLAFAQSPGSPTLTVVGTAVSVSQTADAWVTPEQLQAMAPAGSTPGYQMLYRFGQAATDGQLAADRTAIAASLPAGTLTGTRSWLSIRQLETANTAAFVPFVIAFGVLALVLSVLIIAIVVGGAVGAATRRIGILKALGFSPAQVVRAYVAQALIPATVGVALGLVVGNLVAIPVLAGAESSFGTTGLSIPAWVDAAVAVGALLSVATAAIVPALRAGRLRAADAIAVGRTPRAGRGQWAQRLAGRLRLARPISLGLANPFARPARSTLTGATVAFGVATVTLAVGLGLSLTAVQQHRELDAAGSVIVRTDAPPVLGGKGVHVPAPGNPPAQTADAGAVAAAITAQPGTAETYGLMETTVAVSGIAGSTTVRAYSGDSSWGRPQMVAGHWLDGPGEAVVTGRFLTAAGIPLGQTVTLTDSGRSITLRVVGEAFWLRGDGMQVLTTASTVAALGLPADPTEFRVELASGTDAGAYLDALNRTLQPIGAGAAPMRQGNSEVIAAMTALISVLAVLLVVVAALGVLNTVVLDTRDRVHELGVAKAVGMTPRQTITMVLTSVGGIGLLAGAVGVPIGMALHRFVLPEMVASTGEHLPASDIAVFSLEVLGGLMLGGVIIAVLGALLPAGWAARIRPATALRTE